MMKQLSFGRARGPSGKQWVHSPETLQRGHIVYNVKFLGNVEVDQPKGSEVVRDAIRKMKFNKQIKKAEGLKPLKVELTVSIDAITIQEPKYKVVQFQYPLHQVSYCADDKADKRMFTFIAKEKDTNKHMCFVFDSEKCAEEITLTVGQAFDLAYRRFLESSSRDIDMKKQYLLLQKKVQQLTQENLALKQRVCDLERIVDAGKLDELNAKQFQQPVVGRKLENLMLDDVAPPPVQPSMSNGSHRVSSPSAGDNAILPTLAPPPPIPSRSSQATLVQSPTSAQPAGFVANNGATYATDLFGAKPFSVASQMQSQSFSATGDGAFHDPFGMGTFSPTGDIDQQISSMDRELLDLQTGFSRGLMFGTEDFSLEDLDPLKK